MTEKDTQFAELFEAGLHEMICSLGKLCLEVRLRNHLTQEYVAEKTGVSERSIFQIERTHNTSLDLVNELYMYYCQSGYIREEEQKICNIQCFLSI